MVEIEAAQRLIKLLEALVMKASNVKTENGSLVNYDLHRMVESVEGPSSKVALTLAGPMTQQEVYKALMNVRLDSLQDQR
ncbi:MAG: hypothetical protein RL497_3159 [Pseudomonadota bacterium]|jgi:hypothetical protein